MPKESEIKIGLTMGDPNGIGPEVLIRALHSLHPFNEWEPLIFGDLAIIKEINNNQRSPRGVFISCSHRRPNQKSNERINVAIAYTSASTALNQKLSEKQKAKAPTAALPKKANRLELLLRD